VVWCVGEPFFFNHPRRIKIKSIKNHPLRGATRKKFSSWGLHTPSVMDYIDRLEREMHGCSDSWSDSDIEDIRTHLALEFDSRWSFVSTGLLRVYITNALRKSSRACLAD
jgi:hypothetical protein